MLSAVPGEEKGKGGRHLVGGKGRKPLLHDQAEKTSLTAARRIRKKGPGSGEKNRRFPSRGGGEKKKRQGRGGRLVPAGREGTKTARGGGKRGHILKRHLKEKRKC